MRHFPPPAALGAVLLVMAAVALVPGGAALGVLAAAPILLGSAWDRRADLLLVGGVAVGGFVAATAIRMGREPFSLAWAISLVTLLAATALAVRLQRSRLAAAADRDAARSASEVNRLLMSLLAHDLRSPLVLADQGFEYVEDTTAGGYPVDRALLADIRARLQRSLRAIQIVLTLATDSPPDPADDGVATLPVRVRDEIEAEAASFRYEAEARHKRLVVELEELSPEPLRVDGLVLRQAVAIALDNAIRYSSPGPIRLRAVREQERLAVLVSDSGPGLSAHRSSGSGSGGSGLGLRLCGALLARSGGSLDVERDAPDGTTLAVRLPIG